MRQNCGEHSMRSAARSMEGSKRTGDFFFDFLRTSSVETVLPLAKSEVDFSKSSTRTGASAKGSENVQDAECERQ
jgi:hypothetical protein